MREDGATVLLVSHSLETLQFVARRGILLEQGHLMNVDSSLVPSRRTNSSCSGPNSNGWSGVFATKPLLKRSRFTMPGYGVKKENRSLKFRGRAFRLRNRLEHDWRAAAPVVFFRHRQRGWNTLQIGCFRGIACSDRITTTAASSAYGIRKTTCPQAHTRFTYL